MVFPNACHAKCADYVQKPMGLDEEEELQNDPLDGAIVASPAEPNKSKSKQKYFVDCQNIMTVIPGKTKLPPKFGHK